MLWCWTGYPCQRAGLRLPRTSGQSVGTLPQRTIPVALTPILGRAHNSQIAQSCCTAGLPLAHLLHQSINHTNLTTRRNHVRSEQGIGTPLD